MNKKSLFSLLGLVVVLGFIVFLVNDKGKLAGSSINTNLATNDGGSYKTVNDACVLFTLEDAKKVIGETAKADTSVAQTADGGEVVVTACTYSATDDAQTLQTASLLIRSPKTSAGVSSNLAQFTVAKPENSQNISGVGDSAYWNPELGQLNVLSQGNWIIITAGPTTPSNRTQDQALEVANIILPKI